MAWIKYGEILAPINYYSTIYNYNTPRNISKNEIMVESEQIRDALLSVWGDLRGWWLSGALNITLTTKNPSRAHTNTDVIVLNDEELLKQMCERAKALSLFPTSRVSSRVPLTGETGLFELFPDIKYEKYVLADPKVMASNTARNKDYMLCKFDQDGKIVDENNPHTRVRLFVHARNHIEGRYVSLEDGLLIPGRYISYSDYEFRVGRVLALDKSNGAERLVLSSNMEYMLSIHKEALIRLEKSKKRWFKKEHVLKRIQKHEQEIQRINHYLVTHPDYMHTID